MEDNFIKYIEYSIQNYLFQNAIFLAERFHALLNNENSLYILANVYYRSGKPNKVYSILKNNISFSKNK